MQKRRGLLCAVMSEGGRECRRMRTAVGRAAALRTAQSPTPRRSASPPQARTRSRRLRAASRTGRGVGKSGVCSGRHGRMQGERGHSRTLLTDDRVVLVVGVVRVAQPAVGPELKLEKLVAEFALVTHVVAYVELVRRRHRGPILGGGGAAPNTRGARTEAVHRESDSWLGGSLQPTSTPISYFL